MQKNILRYVYEHETNVPMLYSLQILRGLAAWAVVFHHIVKSYFMGDEPNIFWALTGQYGTFGVDIFFVLSGFVMGLVSQNNTDGKSFLINRIYRVYPIYWFYTALLVISLWMLPIGTYLTEWNLHSLLMSLSLMPNLNPNGYGYVPTLYVGWTLAYEIFFYLLFALVLWLKAPKPAAVCAGLLILIAALPAIPNFLGHSSLLLIEFALGISALMLFQYSKIFSQMQKVFMSFMAVCIYTFLAWYFKAEPTLMKAFFAADIVIICVALEPIVSKDKPIVNFLINLGKYSYSTYLNHIIIIGWCYYVFGTSESQIIRIIGIITVLCLTYFISRLSYQHIETNTWLNRSKLFIIKKISPHQSQP